MQNFVIIALGRAHEIGYDTEELLAYAGQQLLTPAASNDLPHAMMAAYIVPTLDNNNQWFTSWIDIYTQYTDDYVIYSSASLANSLDSDHGYPAIAMAAASYLSNYPNHPELWLYIQNNIASKDIFNDNPKWAILPRTE